MNAIKLSVLAEKFENDLNAILKNPEIQFKIWSEAGEYQAYRREDNTVIWYINGNLRRVTSSNDANDLVMGVNGLSLDFVIPIKRPRTNSTQTEEELAKIKDGQYPFVEYITNAINSYFEKAQVFTVNDGGMYSVAFRAGINTTGTVDLASLLGNHIGVSVYIELYYIQNGVNSKEIKITVDGQKIPYQALRYGRSPMLERDVRTGTLISKSVVTSTAFAIDIDLPTNAPLSASAPVSVYLLNGTPNVAHFVNLNIDGTEYDYFMTVNSAQASAQGISIAGTSVSYMEVSDGFFNPGSNAMGRFILPNSSVKQITATVNISNNPYDGVFLAYVGGKCGKFPLNFVLDVKPEMVRYDKTANVYYVDIVYPGANRKTITNPKADGVAITYEAVWL